MAHELFDAIKILGNRRAGDRATKEQRQAADASVRKEHGRAAQAILNAEPDITALELADRLESV